MGLYKVSGRPRHWYTHLALETSILLSSWLLQALLGILESSEKLSGPVWLDVPMGRVINPLALPEIVLILVLKAPGLQNPLPPSKLRPYQWTLPFRVLPILHALFFQK